VLPLRTKHERLKLNRLQFRFGVQPGSATEHSIEWRNAIPKVTVLITGTNSGIGHLTVRISGLRTERQRRSNMQCLRSADGCDARRGRKLLADSVRQHVGRAPTLSTTPCFRFLHFVEREIFASVRRNVSAGIFDFSYNNFRIPVPYVGFGSFESFIDSLSE
jgi:hypothetical protein